MNGAATPSNSQSNLLAWLQLMRISAIPTAASNILAGFLLAHHSWLPVSNLLLLITSSVCLYVSGMIFNDYCDREVDAQSRENRPIPSGSISPSSAFAAYVCLSLVGIAVAAAISLNSALIAVLLGVAIYSYNRVLKKTPAAPLMMGTCRFLNILLGASSYSTEMWFSFPGIVFWVAAAIGIFICGLTWFARNESTTSNSIRLTGSAVVIMAGIAGLALTGFIFESPHPERVASLIALVSIPAVYRVYVAVIHPEARFVQQAVRALIQSLILFDAAVCILARPDQPLFAITTMALLLPAMLLSKFISST